MSKDLSGNVITANNLLDGTVVYMSSQFKWVLDINNAKVFSNDTSIEKALIHANKQQHEVVGVYSIRVDQTDTGIKSKHIREQFRVKGPSNYNHGKQSEVL